MHQNILEFKSNLEEDGKEVISDIQDHGEETNQADSKATVGKLKPKRIRNLQPKFNEEVLRGQRGLTNLPLIFKKVNMKGRGHEKEDLCTIMRAYTYWCHRMFPKYPFNACVEKLEKMGTKKRTMVYLQRIRAGLEDGTDTYLSTSNTDDNEERNNSNDTQPEHIFTCNAVQQSPQIELSEEIMEQIRANRERALQIRINKLREKEHNDKTLT